LPFLTILKAIDTFQLLRNLGRQFPIVALVEVGHPVEDVLEGLQILIVFVRFEKMECQLLQFV
jgi:hypothetical protein